MGRGRASYVNDATLVRSTLPKYKEGTSGKSTEEPQVGRREDRGAVGQKCHASVVCHKASVGCIMIRSDQ